MHRNNKLSKSTKRRRLLDEQYLHEHLFEIRAVFKGWFGGAIAIYRHIYGGGNISRC